MTKTLYIFEQLIKNLMQVKHEAGVWIPLYIMTSEKNDVQTRTFFEEHDFFGYDSSYVKFFVQEMVPAVDFDGNILMESEDSRDVSNGKRRDGLNPCSGHIWMKISGHVGLNG